MPEPEPSLRWFEPRGFVEDLGDRVRVWLAGTLIGDFAADDRASRDSILLHLTSNPRVRYGKLALAFGVSLETLRTLRRQRDAEGLVAVINRPRPGRPTKVTPELKARVYSLFDEGYTVRAAAKKLKKKLKIRTVARLRKEWGKTRTLEGPEAADIGVPSVQNADADAAVAEAGRQQELLRSEEPAQETDASDASVGAETRAAPESPTPSAPPQLEATAIGPRTIRPLPLRTESHVQHAGAWILLALVASDGLYKQAREAFWEPLRKKGIAVQQLYIAMDALVLANLMKAPGSVRVNERSVTVSLAPAANACEQKALRALLDRLSSFAFSLPRDDQNHRLRFRLQED